MSWEPRGLEKCTIDRWSKAKGYKGKYAPILSDIPADIDKFQCLYSIRWEGRFRGGDFGPEHRCSKIVGHYGDHKWYHSDEHGDYDLWWDKHKYDYQLEEL